MVGVVLRLNGDDLNWLLAITRVLDRVSRAAARAIVIYGNQHVALLDNCTIAYQRGGFAIMRVIRTIDKLLNAMMVGKTLNIAIDAVCASVQPDCTGKLVSDSTKRFVSDIGVAMSGKSDVHTGMIHQFDEKASK